MAAPGPRASACSLTGRCLLLIFLSLSLLASLADARTGYLEWLSSPYSIFEQRTYVGGSPVYDVIEWKMNGGAFGYFGQIFMHSLSPFDGVLYASLGQKVVNDTITALLVRTLCLNRSS